MKKRLYRNSDRKLLAGVLSGLAGYFDQDVLLWRMGFIFLLIATGLMPGVLFYVIAWIIVPAQPTIEPVAKTDYAIYN